MIGTIINAAAGVAGSIIGGLKASREMKKVRRLIGQQERDNQNWYDRRVNQDYTQTAAAQDAIRRTRQYADELIRRAEGNSIVNGAAQETLAEARRQASQAVGNTMASLAAGGDAIRQATEQQYRRNKRHLTQQRIALHQQKAQNISQAATF